MNPLRAITGATCVAGVVGAPVTHSLSPLIHNAWLAAAGIDGAYLPFSPTPERFAAFVDGLRAGSVLGLNVTLPFKEEALALADEADLAARRAGAANLLLFRPDGAVAARNTDGLGLLAAFAEQAPGWTPAAGPVVVLGAGGAARGAVAVLAEAGAEVRIVNRTPERAQRLAAAFAGVRCYSLDAMVDAFAGAAALINASAAGLKGGDTVDLPLSALPADAVVMDMVYAPLKTSLLAQARARGLRTVDGLAMLIGQARPSFEALFGQPPPALPDVRALALGALQPARAAP